MDNVNVSEWENDEVIQRLREYLKIPSVHPDINYDECVSFLQKQAAFLDLPVVVHELVPKKPVVVITWQGMQPDQPTIMLNSHMDVVPVYEEHWDYPPFEAKIAKDGYIYARGSQDMKSVGMIYLEVVRRLKNTGVRLKRTLHITFVPDEEIGSLEGMRVFCESEEFRKLNVAFELDESGPSPIPNTLILFNGERTTRQIKVTCRGTAGHGSFLQADTAGEKLYNILGKFMKLRDQEMEKINSSPNLYSWSGEVTAVNLTKIEGGVQVNIIPESFSATFDLRIPPHVDHDAFDQMIDNWCKEAGEGVSYEYILKNPEIKETKVDGSVPFWTVLCDTIKSMGIEMDLKVCPGATDARFVRQQGIPAINLSPILDTPLLIHSHNERLHVDIYKKGIDIMENIITNIANI